MNSDQKSSAVSEKRSKRGIILDSLFQGFLILLPLTIVLILLSIVFNFIFRLVSPLSSVLGSGADDPHWILNLLSLAILCVFVFLIGLVVRNKVGKVYFKIFEKKYLSKIPLYTLIHQTVFQFVGLKKLPFSEVVLIDPYKTGALMTGFVTDQISGKLYTVFVPTAPNPTNGLIYHVPKEQITFLSASTQDALRTVMGMGTGTANMLAGVVLPEVFNDPIMPDTQNSKVGEDGLNTMDSSPL